MQQVPAPIHQGCLHPLPWRRPFLQHASPSHETVRRVHPQLIQHTGSPPTLVLPNTLLGSQHAPSQRTRVGAPSGQQAATSKRNRGAAGYCPQPLSRGLPCLRGASPGLGSPGLGYPISSEASMSTSDIPPGKENGVPFPPSPKTPIVHPSSTYPLSPTWDVALATACRAEGAVLQRLGSFVWSRLRNQHSKRYPSRGTPR